MFMKSILLSFPGPRGASAPFAALMLLALLRYTIRLRRPYITRGGSGKQPWEYLADVPDCGGDRPLEPRILCSSKPFRERLTVNGKRLTNRSEEHTSELQS